MIARLWRGRTKAADADRYLAYLEATGLKDYAAVRGVRSVQALRRIEGDVAELLLITHWDSMAAIKQFTGDDPETAVYYPEDDEFLLEKEPTVTHYEVVFDRSPGVIQRPGQTE